jgi:hypothetical protein
MYTSKKKEEAKKEKSCYTIPVFVAAQTPSR